MRVKPTATARLHLRESERERVQALGSFGLRLLHSLGLRATSQAEACSTMQRLALAEVSGVGAEELAKHTVEIRWLEDGDPLPEAGRLELLHDRRVILVTH